MKLKNAVKKTQNGFMTARSRFTNARTGLGLGCLILIQLAVFAPTQAQEGALETEKATFAGGCFWCMEPPFDQLEGVISTVSGYANGHVENPSYEQVTAGGTGHVEALQVTYDPARVSYEDLLEVYWPNTDPTDAGGQFCDRGESYTPAIFFHNEQQQDLAEASRQSVVKQLELDSAATAIEPLQSFYPAEDYHQDYYKKNPVRYNFYKWNCGREQRLDELWGETRRLELF